MTFRFYLAIFGCQMNTNDGDRLRTLLIRGGGEEAPTPENADVIFFVTCSIRQHAEDRIFGLLRKYADGKKILALTGCMVNKSSTRFSEEKDPLLHRSEYIDFVFRIQDAPKLPEMLRVFFPLLGEYAEGEFRGIFDAFPTQRQKASAFVPISTGCDHHCTYCIVPHTRGEEQCRSREDILRECVQFLRSGAREITLLGQNVNRWYRGVRGKNPFQSDFAELLDEVAQLPGLRWLRFMSPHPQHLGDDVLEVMAKHHTIARHLHLPVQSGDDRVLRRMARGYTREKFQKILQKARTMMPDLAVSTDVIVGFCGETEEEFLQSVALCTEESFDMIYIGKFSVRPHTPAAKWDDSVPLEEKKNRFHILNTVLRKTAAQNLQKEVGKTRLVLVDRVSEEGIAEGHTEQMRKVFFPVGKRKESFVGELVPVQIQHQKVFFLQGELESESSFSSSSEEL